MTEPVPKRPWWRKKRWWAALALWLAVAYPASLGPVGYGIGRGWVSQPIADLYVVPLEGTLGQPDRTVVGRRLRDYAQWWIVLGERHAASE